MGFNQSRKHTSENFKFENEYELQPKPVRDADLIPLRLNMRERKIQRLMRGIILASCYTDKVDTASLAPPKRDALIAKELVNALTGLIVGLDVKKAAGLLRDKDFTNYKADIQMAIETFRRYKIMNPDLLRTDYVKFLYMVQDAMQNPYAQEALGFSVASPLVTVGRYCAELDLKDLLEDPRLPLCITPVPVMRNRNKLNKCLRCKDVTVNEVVKEYAKRHNVRPDSVELAVRSLNDANCFSNDNVKTTTVLLDLLNEHFHPEECDERSSLAIEEGTDGSRLSHDHARQFAYVKQSIMLWKNINHQMFALWTIAEEDMLNPNEKYELRATGQGLQRVQKAPNLYKAVRQVLRETQEELGNWVGSERIHLGDNQVPNAFNFINKYGQVSRIIVPILRTIEHVDTICARSTHHSHYVQEVWGGPVEAKRAILRDFFRHGFDGSGGDNMDDAGSCIDGRLTSAWNWCNNIRFKPFYPLFLLAGFSSFDGDMST